MNAISDMTIYDVLDMNTIVCTVEIWAYELYEGAIFSINNGITKMECVRKQVAKHRNDKWVHITTTSSDVALKLPAMLRVTQYYDDFIGEDLSEDIKYAPEVLEGHTRLYRFAPRDNMVIGKCLFYSFEPRWEYGFSRQLYIIDVPTEDLDNAVDLDVYDQPVYPFDWNVAPSDAGWYSRTPGYKEVVVNSDEAMSRMVVRGCVKVPASPWE